MLDGYVDPDVLVVGVRTRLEDERNWQGKIGQKELLYYSADREHLDQVRKRISDLLDGMLAELKDNATVSEIYELTRTNK